MTTFIHWHKEFGLIVAMSILLCFMAWILNLSFSYAIVCIIGSYFIWHLLNLYWLIRWLESKRYKDIPASKGVWGDIFTQLYYQQRRQHKRYRRISRALKEFKQSTAALPDAAVVLREGRLEWWNPAAANLLGFRRKIDKEQSIIDLLPNPKFIKYFTSNAWEEPLQILSPLNENIKLDIRLVNYGKDQCLLYAEDITRLQHLENVRRDFVANVSHELRTPLTVVSGYAENLLQYPEGLSDNCIHAVKKIYQQAERMNSIVSDLLLLSHLELDKEKYVEDTINVHELLLEIEQSALQLSDHQHHLKLTSDANLIISGNKNELQSAFSNLVFNAVRYTPQGGDIDIIWEKQDECAIFSVKDTGIGIDPQHIPRLTERFYRVDTGRSRATGGTGLGLAIVKHVISRHDAQLEIISHLGEGSTFRCIFPLASS